MRLLPPDHAERWTPYVWLIYLNVYVGWPFVFPVTAARWGVLAAGLCAFLALYFAAHWLSGTRRLAVIASLAALGLALTWMNPGACVFFVYAASFVGGARTGRAAAAWISAITVAGLAAAATAGVPWGPWAGAFVAVFAPLIGWLNVSDAENRRRAASLRLAHEEIARLARLAERDRIAGDLHDLLGHTLSAVALKAELAAKLANRDPARAAGEAAEVARIAREALAEVRQAVHGFRQASFADELVRARALLESAGVEVIMQVPDTLAAAPGAHALAFVLREAVTNVVRHAAATRCSIRLGGAGDGDGQGEGGRLVLTVHDDGRGAEIREGNGWRGMRERVEAAGGSIGCDVGSGTRLTASVPFSPAPGAAP